MSPETDRKLLELITDLDGAVSELGEIVAEHGTTLVSRVIADGIGAVFPARDRERVHTPGHYGKQRSLPPDEALRIVELEQIPADYRIALSLDTLDPQLDGTLMLRYAADDPAAIAEVRSRAGLE